MSSDYQIGIKPHPKPYGVTDIDIVDSSLGCARIWTTEDGRMFIECGQGRMALLLNRELAGALIPYLTAFAEGRG